MSETSQPADSSSSNSSSSPSQHANYSDAKIIEQLRQQLQFSEPKVQLLEERLREILIKKYGVSSEKLSSAQLELLELEPGVCDEEVQAESECGALPPESEKPEGQPDQKPAGTRHPGRQSLPSHLPRKERVIACTTEQCTWGGCGTATTVIGYEESEQLEMEPAKYFVLVTKREKRACKQCEELGVVAAPLPQRIIEKSLVSDQVILDTIVAKYCDALPLYRQSVMLKRDTGVDISRSTMVGWVMRVGELLVPIAAVMRRELLSGSYIQADETPVDVQMHDGRGKDHQAYLWQYGTPGSDVVFDFRLGRGRDGPKQFLQQFDGILQTDGYAAYEHIGGPKIVHAVCWSHARRKFVEAVKLSPKDVVAIRIVARMDDLFAIDAEVRREKPLALPRHR